MGKRASRAARQALREKLVPEHEHKLQHVETVIHDDGREQHCYHYMCMTKGCDHMIGINLSNETVESHKWKDD